MPKSVQDAIPIRRLWPDGIFQFGNKFSKTLRFSDINYAIASKEDKTAMFLDYSELLNALDAGSTTKITINNKRVNREDFEREILLPRQDDALDGYRAEYNAMLTELIAELKAGGESVKPRRRLMLLSGHANTAELLSALESQGALIVVDDASNGLRMAEKDISEEGDPFAALCDFYFNVKTPMPRAFGTQDRRFETYLRLFDEYRADGIVSARVTMCDLWAFEQYMLANLLREKDIPSLELEINYLMDSVGQVRTRVQAFVENLPRRSA